MTGEVGFGLAPRLELLPPSETIQEEEGEIMDNRMRERSFDTQATVGDDVEDVGNDGLTSIADIEEGSCVFLTPEAHSPELTPTASSTFEVHYSPPSPPTTKPHARSIQQRSMEEHESTDSEIGEGLMEEGPSSQSMNRGFSTLSGSTSGQTADSSVGTRTPKDSPQALSGMMKSHGELGEEKEHSRGRADYREAFVEGEWMGSGKSEVRRASQVEVAVAGSTAGVEGQKKVEKTTPKKSHKQQKKKGGKSK